MTKWKSEKVDRFLIITETDNRGCEIKSVFLNYVPVVHFNLNEVNERKVAVIELIEQGLCNQRTAGLLCGFHRNTVFKILRTKEILGLEGVLIDDRGRKEPYKYINEVRSHLKKLLRQHPDWSDSDIADLGTTDLGIDISRSAVARIRTEKKKEAPALPTKNELLDKANLAELIEQEMRDNQQQWLNFESEPELKQVADEASKEPSPKAETENKKKFIERLQQGTSCAFAGGFMHHLFLQEIGFRELMGLFPTLSGSAYQSQDVMGTLFHFISQGIPSIEALKLVNASELGMLIGRCRTPDKGTLRDHLQKMGKLNLSSDLIDKFARLLLAQDRIDREVFFIDGHFLPYYGLNVIAKGYFTVRSMVMKGNELYAITDLQGRPLFFITESNEIDFRPIISQSANMLVDLGIARPILVFDRGGYGVHFFTQLDPTADFVTWAKHLTKETLQSIPDASFKVGVYSGDKKFLVAEESRTVSESIQTAKNDGRETADSMELRLIILKNIKTGKRMGILTNNRTKPTSDIAYYMLQRWGKSEKFFKETMAKFYLNYHPGYDIKELEKQPLVENPDIALTKKAIQVLKKEMEKLETEVAFTELKLQKRKDKRSEKKIASLNESLLEKKKDIIQLKQNLSTLPDKISILDILKGKAMSRCDLEKKKLFDLMQFMVYHSRERLVEIFGGCYNDHRDIKSVLDMITRKSGMVKLVGGTLIVILDWIENKKHREAAVMLCRSLNQKGIRLIGGLDVKLSFHLAKIPHHCTEAL